MSNNSTSFVGESSNFYVSLATLILELLIATVAGIALYNYHVKMTCSDCCELDYDTSSRDSVEIKTVEIQSK